MKELNPDNLINDIPPTMAAVIEPFTLDRYELYVGLDVHKETIAVAVARAGRAH